VRYTNSTLSTPAFWDQPYLGSFFTHRHDMVDNQFYVWNVQSCQVCVRLYPSLSYTDDSRHDRGMLQAFNPYYAFDYLIRNQYQGWRSLGGILLCFTGVEVLFAGIGAFSRQAIQVSWIGFVYPSLLLTYIGQAAYISEDPDAYADPFFNCAPPGWLIPSFIIAVCAAVVASQAIITATFHVSHQILGSELF
jgi:KUP system potassium uptake protein